MLCRPAEAFDPHNPTFFGCVLTARIFLVYLVFWGPRSFQFDLEMNINIYCMHYIIREDSQEVLVGPLFRV